MAHTPERLTLRATTEAMLDGFAAEGWTDDDMRAPSVLPDWTRGHVLTHIARNADGIVRTLDGALRGERVARYPDGQAGRNADIEAGAGRPVTEQLADVRDSAARLDDAFAAIDAADGWGLECDNRTAGQYLTARWREVEIHRVDVLGAYTPAQWPPGFVDYLLPRLADQVEPRLPTPVRIEVRADGSVTEDLAGRTWTSGAGEPVEVTGPDWAVLAWLLGRPSLAAGALSATPELAAWL